MSVLAQDTTSAGSAHPESAESVIQYDDFAALDIRIARVLGARVVEDADRLLELTLDVGELGERTVVSGIRAWYEPEALVGTQVVYLANLAPRMLRGIESQGMILAATDESQEGSAVLLSSSQQVPDGSVVR